MTILSKTINKPGIASSVKQAVAQYQNLHNKGYKKTKEQIERLKEMKKAITQRDKRLEEERISVKYVNTGNLERALASIASRNNVQSIINASSVASNKHKNPIGPTKDFTDKIDLFERFSTGKSVNLKTPGKEVDSKLEPPFEQRRKVLSNHSFDSGIGSSIKDMKLGIQSQGANFPHDSEDEEGEDEPDGLQSIKRNANSNYGDSSVRMPKLGDSLKSTGLVINAANSIKRANEHSHTFLALEDGSTVDKKEHTTIEKLAKFGMFQKDNVTTQPARSQAVDLKIDPALLPEIKLPEEPTTDQNKTIDKPIENISANNPCLNIGSELTSSTSTIQGHVVGQAQTGGDNEEGLVEKKEPEVAQTKIKAVRVPLDTSKEEYLEQLSQNESGGFECVPSPIETHKVMVQAQSNEGSEGIFEGKLKEGKQVWHTIHTTLSVQQEAFTLASLLATQVGHYILPTITLGAKMSSELQAWVYYYLDTFRPMLGCALEIVCQREIMNSEAFKRIEEEFSENVRPTIHSIWEDVKGNVKESSDRLNPFLNELSKGLLNSNESSNSMEEPQLSSISPRSR